MLTSEGLIRIVRNVVKETIKERGKENEILYSDLKLGRVAPNYSGGRPSIVFNGEASPSGKKYPYLSSYTPAANDVVILGRVAGSYVVLGKRI